MTRFSRWSQRKRGLEPIEETAPEHTPSANDVDSVADREPLPTAPGEETPPQEPADELPDPDTLPPGSDLTAYLSSGVGRELRRKALKRLFAADHYHHRDGLNDYDDDYRKLNSLSQEVADRLRQWTRQPDAEEGEKSQAQGQTENTNTAADETSQVTSEDTPEADDSQEKDDETERLPDDDQRHEGVTKRRITTAQPQAPQAPTEE